MLRSLAIAVLPSAAPLVELAQTVPDISVKPSVTSMVAAVHAPAPPTKSQQYRSKGNLAAEFCAIAAETGHRLATG
jgi:hypothetical protein